MKQQQPGGWRDMWVLGRSLSMAWELTRRATRMLSATSSQNHCLNWPSQGGHLPTHITRHPDVKWLQGW